MKILLVHKSFHDNNFSFAHQCNEISISPLSAALQTFLHYYAALARKVDDAHCATSVGSSDIRNIESRNLTRANSHFLAASANNTQGQLTNWIIQLGLLSYPKGWLPQRGHQLKVQFLSWSVLNS